MPFSNHPLKYAALFCLGLLCANPLAHAEEETPEHGKINMPDASPVDPGHYEVEVAYSYGFAKKEWNNSGKEISRGFESEQSFELSATAGVSDDFDVSVSFGHTRAKDKDNDFDGDGNPGPLAGDGFGDLNIGGRWRFIQNENLHLDVAYIGGFTIPTGTGSDQNEIGTSQEYWSLNQTLVASKDWGNWTANMDVGFALPFGDKRGDARGTFNADLAAGYQALPWLQPELELNYSRSFVAGSNDASALAITAGLVMPINDRWRINAGVQQGLWGINADKSTLFSVAVKNAF
jgi:hypothetical protein